MLQVGFGSADITPDVGMEMPGGFAKAVGKGIRDRLWAVACVAFDGTNAVALVGTDTLVIGKETVARARRTIEQSTKIPGDNVLVGANHTHSGGPAGEGPGRNEDPKYLNRLSEAIAQAVIKGWQSLHAAEIAVATGKEEGISFNRRFLMRDGREITHPGKPGTPHHGEIVAPAGPIDSDVGILAVRNAGGKIAGFVVNFACHSTVVGGDQFSPDYAGYLRKHLKARYGEGIEVVFLLGACGDITQVNNLVPGRESGPDHADMMGMRLASEVQRLLPRVTWLKEAPVAVARETPVLSIRQPPNPEAERPPFGLGSGQEEFYARSRQLVEELRQKTPRVPVEVQAIRIGPLGIVTNGSEYFCDGLRIKRCSPLQPTWFVSLANEALGYVPTAQAFVAGGYEPRTGRSSKFAPETGQQLLEAALRALGKLAPAKALPLSPK